MVRIFGEETLDGNEDTGQSESWRPGRSRPRSETKCSMIKGTVLVQPWQFTLAAVLIRNMLSLATLAALGCHSRSHIPLPLGRICSVCKIQFNWYP